jgi:hypothetical protein
MLEPIPRARGLVVRWVNHGPVDRAWLELIGALTVRRYGAPKLSAAARGGRGPQRWRGSEFGGGARCGASGGTEKRNKERHELCYGAVMR